VARGRSIDLVVLDVNLPDISGLEVCRVLKAEYGPPAVQVLQVSNTAISDADQVRGLQTGADVYLTEPIHPDVLVATTKSLLRIRKAERALADALERERGARVEAENANRLKDEFLAALSHELRTPLNAIMGWVWHLKRGGLPDTTRQRALSSIDRNTAALAQLIRELLDVARLSKGKLQLELRLVDLQEVVVNAAETVRGQAVDKGVHLQVSAERLATIGDPGRLEQVVINLISNAIQFTPEKGTVTVSLSSRGDDAIVRVADTGEGIAPDLLPHVFDQFRQGEGGTNRRHGGLGLGLAIVRQLVDLHGGEVSAESPGKGLGSTFTVTVTRATDQEQALAHGASSPVLTNVHALVVEDDPDARELMAAMLEASGARTTTASSAEQALTLAGEQAFDVVVSDIGLPGEDGMALIRHLRSQGYTMPAVAVSAFTGAYDEDRVLDGGFQVYTPKPVQPTDLVRTVASLIRHAAPPA
jgi:signal transduction histidine kinase